MVIEIIKDMMPFLFLTLTLPLGFAFAMTILLSHSQFCDWSSPWFAIYSAINMGLYTFLDPSPLRPYLAVVVFYEAFMVAVQIILLNLLIAIMSESHSRVRTNSQLVAVYERANLVLEQEMMVVTGGSGASQAQRLAVSGQRCSHRCCGLPLFVRKLLERLRTRKSEEQVMPKWLHVLLYQEQFEELDSGGKDRQEMMSAFTDIKSILTSNQQKVLDSLAFHSDEATARNQRDQALLSRTIKSLAEQAQRTPELALSEVGSPVGRRGPSPRAASFKLSEGGARRADGGVDRSVERSVEGSVEAALAGMEERLSAMMRTQLQASVSELRAELLAQRSSSPQEPAAAESPAAELPAAEASTPRERVGA